MQRVELRDGEAAAAASYRVLSRLLGYGAGPEAGAAGGPGSGAAVAGPPGPGGARLPLPLPAPGGAARPPPQLMVFRNAAEGRPGEEEAGGGEGPAGGPELLCPRHRCALEPKAAAVAAGGGWGPPGGLELQLAALGLRPPTLGTKGPAACPCLGPPAAEETSDALLVLEALEPDEAESCSEEEPGSPGAADPQEPPRGAAAARRAGPGPGAAGGRKGSLRVRLSRLFRTKSCSGGSAPGDGSGGSRRGAELTASAHSLSDGGGARGRGQEEGRYGAEGPRVSGLLGAQGCAGGAGGAVEPRGRSRRAAFGGMYGGLRAFLRCRGFPGGRSWRCWRC